MASQMVKWLSSNADRVTQGLPEGWTHTDVVRNAIALEQADAESGRKLSKCESPSLISAVLRASQAGLHFDNGDAYVIPYGQRAKLEISYRGLCKLAKSAGGEVRHIESDVVYEGEQFTLRRTSQGEQFTHDVPAVRSGEIVAAYARIVTHEGDSHTEVMSREQIELVRAQSKAGDSGPWGTWFGEMARKAVIRRALKPYRLAPRAAAAVAADEPQPAEIDLQVVSQTPRAQADASALNLSVLGVDPEPIEVEQVEQPNPQLAAARAVAEAAERSDGVARSLGQLLKGISGEVAEQGKQRILAMDEPTQDEWMTVLRESDDRLAVLEQLVGSA